VYNINLHLTIIIIILIVNTDAITVFNKIGGILYPLNDFQVKSLQYSSQTDR